MQLAADPDAVFGAGAQHHLAGAGLDGVAHQVPDRLDQAVGVALQFRQAGVVVAHQLHRPAGVGLGQAQHAFEHGVEVEPNVRVRRRRIQQAIDELRQARDLGIDQRDQLARGGVLAGNAPRQQLGRTLQAGERIAQLVGQALERGRQRQRQRRQRIAAGELVDRMQLEQPAAVRARGQPGLGEAHGASRTGQRQARQAQDAECFRRRHGRSGPRRRRRTGIQRQRAGQRLPVHFQCRHRQSRQPAQRDPEPLAAGQVAGLDRSHGRNREQRRAQLVEGRIEGRRHCTNLVQGVHPVSPVHRDLACRPDRAYRRVLSARYSAIACAALGFDMPMPLT